MQPNDGSTRLLFHIRSTSQPTLLRSRKPHHADPIATPSLVSVPVAPDRVEPPKLEWNVECIKCRSLYKTCNAMPRDPVLFSISHKLAPFSVSPAGVDLKMRMNYLVKKRAQSGHDVLVERRVVREDFTFDLVQAY